MNKEELRIKDILIKLTNVLGYDDDKHYKAYKEAFEALKELIEEIDNAERL